MKCPRDGTELAIVRVGKIVLDKCHTCDGIWCDPGELKAIRKAKLSDLELELEKAYGNPDVTQLELDGHMRCPRCDGRLIGMTYAPHLPMRVDRCDSCFGYWLDAGELDKALRRRRKKAETQESHVFIVLRAVGNWFAS